VSILQNPIRRIHRAGNKFGRNRTETGSNKSKEKTIMRYLCIYKPAKAEGAPPTQTEMEKMGKYIEQSFKEGTLLATEGCLSSALGARVRKTNGQFKVTDGPFTEAKEIVGGFAIINAKSKEDAIRITKDFLNIAGDGETEIRQLYEQPAK
jgi:hypothetical protein